MLITRRQNGSLTPIGTVLDAAGLSFLPDSYNLDDGVVERARQNALMTYPNLDNVSWLNLAIVDASHGYASEHPLFREQVPPSIAPLLAAGMHEQLHGSPVPEYVDASDKKAADAENAAALEAKAAKEAEAAAAKVAEVKADAVPGGKIVEPTPVVETKQYADGSSATGVAPLPDFSPDEQAELIKFVMSRGYSEEAAFQILTDHAAEVRADFEKSKSTPSAEDLDAVAEEEKLKQATAGSDKIQ